MKKTMWIVTIIPLIVTLVVLQFMPDSVPMHYDVTGEIDRWGSKYENLIFPIIIIAMTLFWQIFVSYFEKKANNDTSAKESVEAKSNAKTMKIVAISMASMFGIMQCCILYGAYQEAISNATRSSIDIGKVSCILTGVMFLFVGNFMPKAKKNCISGVRVGWSMYNDITWMKCNRFGSVALMVVGLLTIITTIFVNAILATSLMLGYLLMSTTAALIYAHKIYRIEVSKDSQL